MLTLTSEQDWNYGINKFHAAPVVEAGTRLRPHDLTIAKINHLKKARSEVELDGAFLEFGVWSGKTINVISETTEETVHGFDSFTGLPEDWFTVSTFKPHHRAGHFARDDLPKVNENVKLWKGWFKDTIPEYIKEHKEPIAFLHVDCDLYSSTIDVLYGLNDYIVEGTVIVFDDFFPWGRKPYSLWAQGEYKALKEWSIEFDRHVQVLYHSSHLQASIKILK